MSVDVNQARLKKEISDQSVIKKEITELLKPLSDTLQRLQALRCSVDCVFNFLQEGCNGDGREQNNRIHQQNFLHNLRDIMHDVMQNCDYLEQSVNVIPNNKDNYMKAIKMTQPISNMGTLSLDSGGRKTVDPDSEEQENVENVLFQQSIHSIDRLTRLRDFASFGDQVLQSRALKRSNYPHAHPNAKKNRPSNASHCLKTDIPKVVLNITRNLELKALVKSLNGHHRVLQVMIGRTMFVHIILRGLNIERVFARGWDEEDTTDDLDLYTESQYEAMRLITTHASAAVLFFTHRSMNSHAGPPDQSLVFFLRWLKSYRNLFTSSCKRCNRHLQKGLPPTWRDFHNNTPYHFECRH